MGRGSDGRSYSAGFSQHVALSFRWRSVRGPPLPPHTHYLATSRHEATYSPNPQLRHQFLGCDLYSWLFAASRLHYSCSLLEENKIIVISLITVIIGRGGRSNKKSSSTRVHICTSHAGSIMPVIASFPLLPPLSSLSFALPTLPGSGPSTLQAPAEAPPAPSTPRSYSLN